MRTLFVGMIGLALFVHPGFAAAEGQCSAALASVGSQWDAMGFAAPSKPMQAQVMGRGGQVLSGADYRRVSNEMRLAAAECQAGQETAALQRVETVKSVLAAGKSRTGAVADGNG